MRENIRKFYYLLFIIVFSNPFNSRAIEIISLWDKGETSLYNIPLNLILNLQSTKLDNVDKSNTNAVEKVSSRHVLDQLNGHTRENSKIKFILISIFFLNLIVTIVMFYKMRRIKHKLKIQQIQIGGIGQNLTLDSYEVILELAKCNSPDFLYRFGERYPSFKNALLEINPDLKSSDLVFCAYLKLNFSSKEIANYTFVTHKSVQIRKTRLRKKLNIPSDRDLYSWMNEL